MLPATQEIERIIKQGLIEDIGRGDVTSTLTIDIQAQTKFEINARQPLTVCGVPIALKVFEMLQADIKAKACVEDGATVEAGTTLILGEGNAQAILAGERVALNLLGHLSGVATLAARYVEAVKGAKAKLLDTRKTLPGLRALQKYAVATGGGHNHRFSLDDGVLIKDNHIQIAGTIKDAVARARAGAPALTRIEVECDTLDQVKEALAVEADMIMLDNMNNDQLKEAVTLVNGRVPLEASGGVNLETIAGIAATGVDFISVGTLTHSAPSVDVGLDIN